MPEVLNRGRFNFTPGWLVLLLLLNGCAHGLQITNLDSFNSSPPVPSRESFKVGVISGNSFHKVNSRYVAAIVQSLQTESAGAIEQVIYPYDAALQHDQADLLLEINVTPRYSGKGSNFWVNWPGFLIWAPAIWGYGYQADISTSVGIYDMKSKRSTQIVVPATFTFREAEIDRTWTEISYLEFSLIALIGGVYFTQYDPDVTDDFITKVSSTYGRFVTRKIISALPELLSESRGPG